MYFYEKWAYAIDEWMYSMRCLFCLLLCFAVILYCRHRDVQGKFPIGTIKDISSYLRSLLRLGTKLYKCSQWVYKFCRHIWKTKWITFYRTMCLRARQTNRDRQSRSWGIEDSDSLSPIFTSHYLISLPFLPHQCSDLDFGRIVMVSQGGVWWEGPNHLGVAEP